MIIFFFTQAALNKAIEIMIIKSLTIKGKEIQVKKFNIVK